jgi:FKBP-type peptidyl-prolyl cis-trans isomerase
MKFFIVASLSVSVALALSGCHRVPEPPPGPEENLPSAKPVSSSAKPASPAPSAAATAKIDKLQKIDVKVGKGPPAKDGDSVIVNYVGRLMDGTKFDSSLDRNQPFTFTLGAGGVIKGWDQGVVGMKVGGKRKLVIPPDLAYGAAGSPPKIPPDAPLQFVIDLLKINGKP